jgi:four helix bundle protein
MSDLRSTIFDLRFGVYELGSKGANVDEKTFKTRTKKLAVEIIRQTQQLPRTPAADIIGRQLIRSGTSIGANYRAACRSKSTADMINKLKIVEEESDETEYWLELLVEAGFVSQNQIDHIYKETDEILAMTIASIKTLRNRKS